MCDGLIIEGHLIPEIRHDLANENGRYYDILCWVSQNCGIASNAHIEEHWRKHSREGDIFWQWYTQEYVAGNVHDIPRKRLDNRIIKRIHHDYRLPKNPFVLRYIMCANVTREPKYILANDMDFHQPTAKRQATVTQNHIRTSRKGALCRFLEKELCIRVGTADDCKTHFSIDHGICSDKSSQIQCSRVTC